MDLHLPTLATPRGRPAHQRSRGADFALAQATLLLGVVGIVALLLEVAPVATLAGAVGLPLGFWSQYVSETRGERAENVIGIALSFLALFGGLSIGGLLG